MKIEEFKYMTIYEAYDNRDWGAGWGAFTTEEEAIECRDRNDTKWTRGTVKKVVCKYPISEKEIILKNINLDKYSIHEQFSKVIEEDAEFKNAVVEGNKEHIIEELWDTFQARLGVAQKCEITAEEVQAGYKKHLEKIPNRPRGK